MDNITGDPKPVTKVVDGTTYTAWDGTISVNTLDGDGNVTNALESGRRTLTVVVTDKAGNATTSQAEIDIDNEAPEIRVTSHSANDGVYGDVILKGSTSIDTASLEYAVSSLPEAPSSGWTMFDTRSMVYWRIMFDNQIDTAISSGDGYIHDYYLKKLMAGAYDDLEMKDNTVWDTKNNQELVDSRPLYIHFRAEDTVGNASTHVLCLNVHPLADIPTVSIASPNGTTSGNPEILGGKITLNGNASDEKQTNEMTIWMQIDTSYNKDTYASFTWDPTDDRWASTGAYPAEEVSYTVGRETKYITEAQLGGTGEGKVKAIKIGDGISWHKVINTRGEFSGSLAIRVFAVDVDGNVSKPDYAFITINSGAPRIGESEPFYLRQYSNNAAGTGTVTASREYKPDMWISGKWWLEGSVEDGDGITSITMNSGSIIGKSTAAFWDATGSTKDSSGNPYTSKPDGGSTGYRVKILVGDETEDMFGSLSYALEAEDNANPQLSASKLFTMNFDNKPPVVAAQGVQGFNISANVEQTNGAYTLGSYVEEEGSGLNSQSGFSHVAVYFVRPDPVSTVSNDESEKAAVYDPMLVKYDDGGNPLNKLLLKDLKEKDKRSGGTYDTYWNADGLYWKKISTTYAAGNKVTLTETEPNVHMNGLIKIDGTTYKIANITGNTSGSSITIDGLMEAKKTDASVTAYVALALIVDNMSAEKIGSGYEENGWPVMQNDDGDGMLEEVQKSNTTWTWEANINSRNIPDGPIEIHYVAFDKAGNHTHDVVTERDGRKAYVSNNAPRIAAVLYGNDDNGNGEVAGDEFKRKNYALNTAWDGTLASVAGYNEKELKQTISIGASDNSALTIKGETMVKPDIVGGNGDLYYGYTVQALDGSGNASGDPITVKTASTSDASTRLGKGSDRQGNQTSGDYSGKASEVKEFSIPVTMVEIIGKDVGATTDGKDSGEMQHFEFTVWDSTDDTTVGTNSQTATINLYATVAMRDKTEPTAHITPFHWNSLMDNSIYGSAAATSVSDLKGHIELEADLPTDTFTGSTGVFDRDPKVSGEIVLTGTVHDNKLLKQIFVHIDGMDTALGAATAEVGKTTTLTQGSGASTETYYLVGTYNATTSSWDTPANLGNYAANGIAFELGADTFTDGHTKQWTMNWDTSKVTGVASLDRNIKFLVKDQGSPKVEDNAIVYTENTGEISRYRVDVVPYITGVQTELNKFKRNNPSVYNRTAKGHYPVRSVVSNAAQKSDSSSEIITVTGFNLNGAVVKDNGNVTVTAVTGKAGNEATFSAEKLTTGDFALTVNGIQTLNNENNNAKEYNKQANHDNNNLLTDDVSFDVWELNDRAAMGIGGSIKSPTMRINPTNGQIGFAYVSEKYFSMPGTVGGTAYSNYYWAASNGSLTVPTFAYSPSGDTFATVMGSAVNESVGDNFVLYMDRLGLGSHNSNGTLSGIGGYRLEKLGYKETVLEDDGTGTQVEKAEYVTSTTRIHSPVLVTRSDSTSLYLLYYDSLTGQIRFKYGVLPSQKYTWKSTGIEGSKVSFNTPNKEDKTVVCTINMNYSTSTYKAPFTPGKYLKIKSGNTEDYYQIVDSVVEETIDTSGFLGGLTNKRIYTITIELASAIKTEAAAVDGNVWEQLPTTFDLFEDQYTTDYMEPNSTAKVTVLAETGSSGRYLSMDCVTVSGTDYLVAVWYNESSHSLQYATCNTSTNDWSDATTLLNNAGEYCQVRADADGGIHIATASDGSGEILYLYLPSYNATDSKKVCVVDSAEVKAGSLSLDVVKTAEGKTVPYISWYCAAIAQPKMAYLVNDAFYTANSNTVHGMVNSEYTGNWEVTVVPTNHDVERDNINVALWKTDAGVQKASDNGTSSWTHMVSAEKSTSYGVCYGNATSNPVLGYAITDGSNGYIETAQMR